MTAPPGPAPGAEERSSPASDREAILRERARELALVRDVRRARTTSILPFEAGGERFGVEVRGIHQVLDASAVSPLLGAPRGVIGAIVSRTRPVPVLDLRQVLGMEGGGLSDLQRVVVLDDAGDLFGIAVERVAPRVDVPDEELAAADGAHFKWIAPGRVAILDPARIAVAARESA
jgi:purine-binding chemotaxis protein CheW